MSGFDLATAGDFSLADEGMADYLKQSEEYKTLTEKKRHPDPFTIAVLVLSLAGVVINILLKKGKEITSISLAIANAGILLLFRYIFLAQWDKNMPESSEISGFIKIKAEFSTGFWWSFFASLIIIGLNLFYFFNNRRDQFVPVYNPENPEPDKQEEL
ncbi:MAG TPA: hypothetical protein PL185_11040 [Flavobacteriales bacterium]|nr:hypothetical protein [Flavobacteriales bacterium]